MTPRRPLAPFHVVLLDTFSQCCLPDATVVDTLARGAIDIPEQHCVTSHAGVESGRRRVASCCLIA